MPIVSDSETKKYTGRNKKTIPLIVSFSIMFLLVGIAIGSTDVSYTEGVFWSRNGDTLVLTNVSENVNIGENATTDYRLKVNGTSYFNDTMIVNGVITASGGNSDNWNDAYSWGDHSLIGYLTDWSDSDPFFNNSDAFHVTSALMDNWNDSYTWGNHSLEGYLTEYEQGFWNRTDTTLYTTTDNDNIQINATLTVDKINLRNETKSWNMYTNETGVMIWEWV